MRVLMTNIIALCDEGLYEELLRYVPTERQEKIARCGKRQDRMRSLAAGLLLEYGLRSMGCSLLPLVPETETVHLVCGTHGKPELSGGAGVHFNLSHAGDYAAAVFDEGEVGIDVEQVRRVHFILEHHGENKSNHIGAEYDGNRINKGKPDRTEEFIVLKEILVIFQTDKITTVLHNQVFVLKAENNAVEERINADHQDH